MYLDQRSCLVLKAIVDNPAATGKDIEQQLVLSRKQLSYTIKKINDYLADSGLEKITRLKTGKFNIPLSVIEEYKSDENEAIDGNYSYTQDERMLILALIILISSEELSTYHFTSELEISKNTLMSDMKKLQKFLANFNIKLFYSRSDGYTLLGSEYSKRQLLINVIKKLLDLPNGENTIIRFCKIKDQKIKEIEKEIEKIESKLEMRFTDQRVQELPYILYLVICRITQGKTLSQLPEPFHHMVGTTEYSTISELASRYKINDPLERMFLTAQIQISNIHHLDKNRLEVEDNLVLATRDVIENFENICCVKINEADKLQEALIQHCKPAFYRIKYNYHIETDITDMVLPQHKYLHEIVSKSVVPFEKLLGGKLPDQELVYLTVLLGSWLRREGLLDFVESRRKAVVVCTNGVSVSNFLFITLKELFPEIEFTKCLSARGFYEHAESFNIVFSTIRLETDKVQFIVKPFLNQSSKQAFREKVFQELEGINLHKIQTESLLAIIEEHADIKDREQLVRELERYISLPVSKNDEAFNNALNKELSLNIILEDLLTFETVKILDETVDWKEAIKIASLPLLKSKAFQPRYLSRMIEIIEDDQPYIMIADGVVIAHGSVNDGVNQVGMGLVKLPERISVGGYLDADIIIVLGTPDTTIHLNALNKLNRILEHKRSLAKLRKAKNIDDILELVTQK